MLFRLAVCCLVFVWASATTSSQQHAEFESLLAAAQAAQARSDFQSAAEFYARAARLRPEIAELNANLGLMYYQTGKDAEAIDALLRAHRQKPGLIVPNLFLGLEYVKLKRFNDAIPYLERAAHSKPADIQAQKGLAQAYAGAGNTRLSIRTYLHATQLEPRNADIWYHLGLSYLEQIEADARILLTRYKESPYLSALMADNFAERRAFIQADDAYKKTLSFEGFPPDTCAKYAFVLLYQHDLAGAERELNSELASNSGSLMARLAKARLDLERGAIEQAAEEVALMWTIDAGFFTSNIHRLNARLGEPKRSEFAAALEKLAAAGRISKQAANLVRLDGSGNGLTWGDDLSSASNASELKHPIPGNAAAMYRKGQYRRCTDALLARNAALSSSDLSLLATCAYSTGDYRHAFEAAERLDETASTKGKGLYWETKSAQMLATEALDHASSLDSNSPKLHTLLGDIYRQRKQSSEAEKEYRKALALQPTDTGALFGLSLALLADDQIDEALGVAQAALKGNSDDPELNAVMGEILCAREDFPAAETYLKKSLNTKPEYVSHVHALLGKVYANTDRPQEAITELKLALPEDKDGRLYFQIGRLYSKTGNRDAAEKAFEVSKRLEREGLNRAAVSLQQPEDYSEPQ